jgi:hypothetical protein
VSIAALLAATACEHTGSQGDYPQGQSTDFPVMMQTDAASYEGNASVTVRLTNRIGRRVGYNLCRSRLERLNDEGDWRETHSTLAEVCTAELRGLAPGQSATYSFRTDPRSRRGQYRIRTALDDPQQRGRLDVVSNPFTVTRNSD